MPKYKTTHEQEKAKNGKKNQGRKVKIERDPIGIFYMIRKIYPICFRHNPAYNIFCHGMGVCFGLLTGAKVMVTQIFFDTIYNASVGKNTVRNVIIAFIFFVLVKLSTDVLDDVFNFATRERHRRILGFLNSEINRKSALIDPLEYEDPRRLDDINKAANGAGAAIHFELITFLLFTLYLPYFVFMGFYLYTLKPMLILCLLFVFVPVLIAQVLRSSVFSKLEDRSAPIRREYDSYFDAVCGKGFFKETRNLGSFKYLINLLRDTIELLNSAIWGANKRSALVDFGFNTVSLLGYGGILFLLVKYLLSGEISIGAFSAVYNSIDMLFGIMHNMISANIGNIADNFGHIRNFLRFLEMPSDQRSDLQINKKDVITLKNVSFKYPNVEKESLKNINLTINPSETIAIVGENGAGKTTLVKLITGLYKPTRGSVKIGETDINTVSYTSLFENISGVFQKYQRYALTLKENIQIADFTADNSEDRVDKILEDNNINKNDRDIFPNGLDTMLSREFDGVDLSGGQWQRIAIARGFYRNSDIIVLDEPTAAIDPIEESSIYKKFVEIAKDKTTIIVTHRMSSAKIAERIIVMKDGEIVEVGSHDELMKNGGVYADIYTAQAGWYK